MTADQGTHSRSAADRAFARFCAHREPADLAEVFDRSAPRLILVAMHLTRDAAAAEDLLQTTFLEAIAAVDRCDPRRPVLPWLLTILTRRAQNERRRRGRDRAHSDGGEEWPDDTLNPARTAEQRETFEQVTASTDSLQKPYREVLALRFVHDLTPAEIARALDRPIGTVHAQLHRGAKRLRAILPRGLAGIIALLIGAERGLAAVRDGMLAALRTPAAGALAGGLALKKLGFAIVLLLSVLALWLPLRHSPFEERSEDVAETATALQVARADRVELEAKRAEFPTDSSGSTEDGKVSAFTGRVVAAESGTPLAGASVRLKSYGPALPAGWHDPEPVLTGSDGRYRAVFNPPRQVQVELWIEHPDRLPALWTNHDVAGGFDIDQGDVKLFRGTKTRIRVVDAEGLAVEGFHLQLKGSKPPLGPNVPYPYVDAQGFTDARGEVPMLQLYPGPWKVENDPCVSGSLEDPGFDISPEDHVKEVILRYQRPPAQKSVSGRVVDERGRPVARLYLRARQGEMGGYYSGSWPDGKFCFGPLDPHRGALRFLLPPCRLEFVDSEDKGRRFEVVAPREPVPIGTADLTVVVREITAVPMQMRVVDPEGNPVERFSWTCAPVSHIRGEPWLNGFLRLTRELDHPGGIAGREDLLPGYHVLVVKPEDPGLALRFAQEFEVPREGECKVRVQLDRRRSWSVRVVDDQESPVAGAQVELLQTITPSFLGRATRSLDQFLLQGASGTHLSLKLQDAITNKAGLVQFSTAGTLGVAGIRVTGEVLLPRLVRIAAAPVTTAPFQIEVQRGATIEGVIKPLHTVLAWGPTAEQRAFFATLVEEEGKILWYMPKVHATEINPASKPRRSERIPVHDDGSFRLTSVPPGSWSLVLSFRGGKNTALGEVDDLRAGECRRFEASIPKLNPAALRGTALVDGERVSARRMLLLSIQAKSLYVRLHKGGFEIPRLLPARYWPALDVGNGRRLFLDEPIELRPGQVCERTIFFVRRQLQLRILTADGKPARGRRVLLCSLEPKDLNCRAVLGPEQTDADGRVVFDPAPPFPVEVLVWKKGAVRLGVLPPDEAKSHSTNLGTVSLGGARRKFVELRMR